MKGACPYCRVSIEVDETKESQLCPSCGRTSETARSRGPDTVAPEARCAKHPNNPARRHCARCGDNLCEVCSTYADTHYVCVRCFEYREEAGELRSVRDGFTLPTYGLVTGILAATTSWACCLGYLLGPSAIVLGIVSLSQIRKKRALPGRGKAIAGIILGTIGILTVVGWIVLRVALSLEGLFPGG